MEQMKNQNEYRDDGKLFIKKIRSCHCKEKIDEDYLLSCKIIQRGEHLYTFKKEDDWITSYPQDKEFWLSADAKESVLKSINTFDAFVNDFMKGEFYEIKCEDAVLSIFYRKSGGEEYDFIVKHKRELLSGIKTEIFPNTNILYFLHYLEHRCDICESESRQVIKNTDETNISEHPLIIAAEKNNDIELEYEVKLYYRLLNSEDCLILGEKLGIQILPPLPDEFDKGYAVDADTLTDESKKVLRQSGYIFIHTPYFSMYGQTHQKYTINPHEKSLIDAAEINSEAISFDDFLKLFENDNLGSRNL